MTLFVLFFYFWFCLSLLISCIICFCFCCMLNKYSIMVYSVLDTSNISLQCNQVAFGHLPSGSLSLQKLFLHCSGIYFFLQMCIIFSLLMYLFLCYVIYIVVPNKILSIFFCLYVPDRCHIRYIIYRVFECFCGIVVAVGLYVHCRVISVKYLGGCMCFKNRACFFQVCFVCCNNVSV